MAINVFSSNFGNCTFVLESPIFRKFGCIEPGEKAFYPYRGKNYAKVLEMRQMCQARYDVPVPIAFIALEAKKVPDVHVTHHCAAFVPQEIHKSR